MVFQTKPWPPNGVSCPLEDMKLLDNIHIYYSRAKRCPIHEHMRPCTKATDRVYYSEKIASPNFQLLYVVIEVFRHSNTICTELETWLKLIDTCLLHSQYLTRGECITQKQKVGSKFSHHNGQEILRRFKSKNTPKIFHNQNYIPQRKLNGCKFLQLVDVNFLTISWLFTFQ